MNSDDARERVQPEPTEKYDLTATDRLVICYALGQLHASPFREHAVRVAKKFGVEFSEEFLARHNAK